VLLGVSDIVLVGNVVEKEATPGEPGMLQGLSEISINTERTEIITRGPKTKDVMIKVFPKPFFIQISRQKRIKKEY